MPGPPWHRLEFRAPWQITKIAISIDLVRDPYSTEMTAHVVPKRIVQERLAFKEVIRQIATLLNRPVKGHIARLGKSEAKSVLNGR